MPHNDLPVLQWRTAIKQPLKPELHIAFVAVSQFNNLKKQLIIQFMGLCNGYFCWPKYFIQNQASRCLLLYSILYLSFQIEVQA